MRTKNAARITAAESDHMGMVKAVVWHRDRFIERPGAVHSTCAACGVSMWLPPCKAGLYKTCGGACSRQLKLSVRSARQRACQTCGAHFIPRQVQNSSGVGRFCSQKCNTSLLEAAFKPEVVARARATWKLRNAEVGGFNKKGIDHPRWMGGPEAVKRRRIESGKSAACCKAYRAKNPDKAREWALNRRFRKSAARLPKGTIPRLRDLQKNRCANCCVSLRKGYHVDHIYPLALGGQHIPENLQLLCPHCNVVKWMKPPLQFARECGRLL